MNKAYQQHPILARALLAGVCGGGLWLVGRWVPGLPVLLLLAALAVSVSCVRMPRAAQEGGFLALAGWFVRAWLLPGAALALFWCAGELALELAAGLVVAWRCPAHPEHQP